MFKSSKVVDAGKEMFLQSKSITVLVGRSIEELIVSFLQAYFYQVSMKLNRKNER